jgi:hypothetical protein
MSVTIEIAVSCTWYQKRLCWMMSSILQQKGNIPNIIFNVAYPHNNGNPTTENVCKFFREQGLNVKETVYPDEKSIQFRGLVRNRQLAEMGTDWVLMSDSDMVYDPFFFEDLQNQLENTDLKNETRCISARRISLSKEYSKDYFNKIDQNIYPCIIENVAEFVSKWPIFKISNSCGAGYFQLANVWNIKKNHNGLYVNPRDCADVPEFEKFHKTKSDKQFRRMLGGTVTIKTKSQYHLNHERDNEEGCKHLTFQR